MEEYISLIENLKGWFAAYNNLLIDEEELAKETFSMMEENTVKFIAFNQGRKDNKLSITALDKELQQEMEYFLLRDKTRFSGMDIDKGYFKEVDALHLIVERWVRIYIQFLNSSKEITEEDKKEEPQPEHQSKPEDSSILPDKLIDEAINAGLLERAGNGLKWVKTAALYGYFIDKVSDKLNLKSSSGRISWKSFMFIENHNRIFKTAQQKVNDYTNKRLNPPEGDAIIDKILKDL